MDKKSNFQITNYGNGRTKLKLNNCVVLNTPKM